MKIGKVILVILLVLLVGFVLFLYNGFNGNPVSKYLSAKALENYVEETYPEKEFQISDGFYNFKNSGYDYTVTEIGTSSKEHDFTVSGIVFPEVNFDGIYYGNLDHRLATRFNNEINEELSPLLSEKINSVLDIEFYIEVLKGTYPDDIAWSKDLTFEKPMQVFVHLDSTEQSEDAFLAAAEEFKNILDTEGYSYESIMFNGSFVEKEESTDAFTSYLKYSIRVDKEEEINPRKVEKHNEE
ncbi:YfjL-like protein [Oceanobacillus sp. CAU 1775]